MKNTLLPRGMLALLLACHTPVSGGGPSTGPVDPTSNGYLSGDCNCDGTVAFDDIGIALANWGASGKTTVLQGDANRDRAVTFSDIALMLASFGATQPEIPAVPGMDLDMSWNAASSSVNAFDPFTGRTVMSYSGCPSWEPYLEGQEEYTELRPTLVFVPKADGYDLIATYDNTPANPDFTGQTRSYGVLNVPGIRFGEDVTVREMRFGARPYPLHVNFSPPPGRPPGCYSDGNQSHVCCGYEWPGDYYSPIVVIADGEYTVAASIQYPVLDYKHGVRIKYESYCWQHTVGGQNWRLNFQLNNRLNPTYGGYNPAANLSPGDVRTYTVSVRIARNTQIADEGGWLRLLQSYRRWHRCLNGPVRYVRDARPVAGYQLAYTSTINDVTNPRGYDSPNLRPDVHGWGPHTAQWDFIYSLGWNRIMIWSLSGLYNRRDPNDPTKFLHNFPFQFYTGVQSAPDFSGQNLIRTELGMLAFIAEPPLREMGLWWGHAADFATEWNPMELTSVDPDNDEHIALVNAELQGAIDLNATMVGLDALGSMNHWQSYWYLQDMQAYAPGKRLIEESRHSDMMHTLAPMYDVALQPVVGNYLKFEGAHYLADFLNPGHEFWGQCDQRFIKTGLGLDGIREPTIAEIQAALSQVAAQGLIVLNFSQAQGHPPIPSMTAAPRWQTSVPTDLRP